MRRIAVVGAGIHGVSVARALAERGHSVVLFDRYAPGHRLGSSHGRSRIVRLAYPDEKYTRWMKEAYPRWKELERASGETILHEVGLLYFGHAASPDIRSVIEGLQLFDVEHEVFGPAEVGGVLPVQLESYEVGVFTPGAGWVHADLAVAAMFRLALAAGVEFRQSEFVDSSEFAHVVICPGAWVRDFLPDAAVQVTRQTTAYVAAPLAGPVWIEDSADFLYGFPAEEIGFKVGVHRPGPHQDLTSEDRTPVPEFLGLIRDLASRRFGVADPELSEATGCLYTTTPTEDFLIAPLDERRVLVSACSGHGFKFGPWIGQVVADAIDGAPLPR